MTPARGAVPARPLVISLGGGVMATIPVSATGCARTRRALVYRNRMLPAPSTTKYIGVPYFRKARPAHDQCRQSSPKRLGARIEGSFGMPCRRTAASHSARRRANEISCVRVFTTNHSAESTLTGDSGDGSMTP